MNIVPHHQHLRKRIYKNLESFPHEDKRVRFLDTTIYVVGALSPIATIPQVYTIFRNHDASGVSLFSWSAYFLFSIIWVVYGFVHKERAIIFTNTLWILMNALVVVGILMY